MSKPSASTALFVKALGTVRPHLTELQLRLLAAHFHAPSGTATARELALVAGGRDHFITNGAYGALGRRLRAVLGMPSRGGDAQLAIFARFLPRDIGRPHIRLALRPQFTRALQILGWFSEEVAALPGAQVSAVARLSASEGERTRRLTIHRSRERSLRDAKIRQAIAKSPRGRLRCEVPRCGFDFEAVYGSRGRGAAEVHHLTPLASIDGVVETTLDDLVVVCANCHRMIHLGGECKVLDELISP